MFVALLFIGTATLTAAYPTNEIKPIPRLRRFSGNWGFICCSSDVNPHDKHLDRTKGIIMFKKQGSGPPKLTIQGVLCIDDDKPEGCIFTLQLFKERNPCNPCPNPRRDMISGIFRGYMKRQWNCEELPECEYEYDQCGCCYDVLCCNHARGPFTGDWFVYHGWLMIMGTYYGQKIWLKAYIGSWFYPGIECYIPTL